MPITFAVEHDREFTKTVATGGITADDIRRHLLDEERRQGLPYRELIDASDAVAEFGSADARSIVDLLRSLGSKGALGPTAVVVSNDVTYGMIRMLQVLLEDVCEVRPFRVAEKAAAETWVAEAPIRGRRGSG